MARPAIFQNPDSSNKTERVAGVVTDVGRAAFEAARTRLAKIVGWPPARISDGDAVEYLARGDKATREHVRAMKAKGLL